MQITNIGETTLLALGAEPNPKGAVVSEGPGFEDVFANLSETQLDKVEIEFSEGTIDPVANENAGQSKPEFETVDKSLLVSDVVSAPQDSVRAEDVSKAEKTSSEVDFYESKGSSGLDQLDVIEQNTKPILYEVPVSSEIGAEPADEAMRPKTSNEPQATPTNRLIENVFQAVPLSGTSVSQKAEPTDVVPRAKLGVARIAAVPDAKTENATSAPNTGESAPKAEGLGETSDLVSQPHRKVPTEPGSVDATTKPVSDYVVASGNSLSAGAKPAQSLKTYNQPHSIDVPDQPQAKPESGLQTVDNLTPVPQQESEAHIRITEVLKSDSKQPFVAQSQPERSEKAPSEFIPKPQLDLGVKPAIDLKGLQINADAVTQGLMHPALERMPALTPNVATQYAAENRPSAKSVFTNMLADTAEPIQIGVQATPAKQAEPIEVVPGFTAPVSSRTADTAQAPLSTTMLSLDKEISVPQAMPMLNEAKIISHSEELVLPKEGLFHPVGPQADSIRIETASRDGIAAPKPDHGPRAAQQIAVALNMSQDGQIELRLDPEELGPVRVSLSPTDGAMTVHLSAERSETLEMLRRHSDALARELRDIGYGDVTFHFGADTPPGGREGQAHSYGETATPDHDVPLEHDPSTEKQPAGQPERSGGLDLRL